MSLESRISDDLKEAMRAKDTIKLETIRQIKSQIKYYQIEKKNEKSLTDEEIITVISKLCKQRKDSIEQYINGNRKDLADKEEAELKILQGYLPSQISHEELEKIIKETIKETGATDKKQTGQVMKAVMLKVKGKAEGKIINQMVGQLLV